jgi:hypothetical protein
MFFKRNNKTVTPDSVELPKREEWFEYATNRETAPELLEKLFWLDESLSVSIAFNWSTPPALLSQIAQKGNPTILKYVAFNKSLPVEDIKFLASKDSEGINIGLASNPSTPGYLLEALYNKNEEEILFSLCENPNTPYEIIKELAKREDMKGRPAFNPAATLEILELIPYDSITPATALRMVGHDSINEDIVQKILFLTATEPRVNRYIVDSPLAKTEDLIKLAFEHENIHARTILVDVKGRHFSNLTKYAEQTFDVDISEFSAIMVKETFNWK